MNSRNCKSMVLAMMYAAVVSGVPMSTALGQLPPSFPEDQVSVGSEGENGSKADVGTTNERGDGQVHRMPKFVQNGVEWLIAAQQENGGWGAGSHAHQEIRDPQKVQVDPATTSFTCLALLRTGHSPIEGPYQANVRKALTYLLDVVERADENGPRITDLQGTQPQTKLGPLVDTALTAQYLARVLAILPKQDELYQRVDRALEKCLAKLAKSQEKDGSWGRQGGWAPVLQSSLACTAIELSDAAGKSIEPQILQRAREYQQNNVNRKSGRAESADAAGVELYAFAGGGRGNAVEARAAQDAFDKGVRDGVVSEAESLSVSSLRRAGVEGEMARRLVAAHEQNQAQIGRLNDETLLAGFGNNGGEEFLSYCMTSETLVISGGDNFHQWDKKIRKRLKKIQNPDGSWSGHHCITSPVFCTAAVVQCVTSKNDVEFLTKMARTQADTAVASAK